MHFKPSNLLKKILPASIVGVLFCLALALQPVKAEDSTTVEWYNKGNVQIGFAGQGIATGGNLGVSLKNQGQYDLDYEIKLSDAGATDTAIKQANVIKADSELTTHVSVGPAAQYAAEVNLYYPGHQAGSTPPYTQRYTFLVGNASKPAEVVQSTPVDQSSNSVAGVAISSPDRKINAGDNFRIFIENTSSSKILYEVNVDDLKTGQFVKKSSDTVEANQSIETWIGITSPGNHRVTVNLLDSKDNTKILSQQMFTVTVTDSNNVNKTSSETAGSKSNSTVVNANLDISKPITHSVSEKVNPNIGDILSGIFMGGDDPTDANLDSVSLLIKKVLEYGFNFAGIVAFIMILWSARIFLNSYGSDEAAAMGKKTLLWAFIGLCVIIISKGILLWIYATFSS